MEIFLSKQDPRELPKGTRDPLGFESVWTKYGRKIISNLTTITGSIEEFSTALLGFYLTEKEDDKQLEAFLRFEQVAAYLRAFKNDRGGYIRGITRVSERLDRLINKKISCISISEKRRDMILSNQSAYGLWGLYSVALESSDLIKDHRPTDKGRKLVSEIIEQNATTLVNFLENFVSNKQKCLTIHDLEHSDSFIDLLDRFKIPLLEILLAPKDTVQAILFRVLKKIELTPEEMQDTKKVVERLLQYDETPKELREKLDDIIKIDRVLSVANTMFDYMRLPENGGKNLSEVAQKVAEDLTGEKIETLEVPKDCNCKDLVEFAKAWNEKDHEKALSHLLEMHKHIIYEQRGSAPWLELDENKRLKQRVVHPNASLKPPDGLFYSYFLNSYMNLYKTYQGLK